MPPKKKEGKGAAEAEEGVSPEDFKKNYNKVCQTLDFGVCHVALNALNLPEGEEDGDDPTVLLCDGVKYGRLGPGGARAVRHALMGIGPGLKEGTPPYRPCNTLKFLYCDLTDPGIGHVAELMKPSTAPLLEIESISIVGENNLTRQGFETLSIALISNTTLLDLTLDMNPTLDDTALRVLSRGMLLKGGLRTLSLQNCTIGFEGVGYIANMLKTPGFQLSSLSLQGNSIGPEGLRAISDGIIGTTTLETLDLRNTDIGFPFNPGLWEGCTAAIDAGWAAFLSSLRQNAAGNLVNGGIALQSLDLRENNILAEGGRNWPLELQEVVDIQGSPLTTLKVDISLDNYSDLWRVATKSSGKKGKGKKK